MTEAAVFATATIFVVATSFGLVRLGYKAGGLSFALAWWCVYLSGGARALSESLPWLSPLVPLLGTCFPAFLVSSALYMTGRVNSFYRPLWFACFAVVAVRLALMPFVSEAVSQTMALVVISAGVLTTSVLLLRPPRRAPTVFEQAIAVMMPAVIAVSAYYTWLTATGQSSTTAQFVWLLVGNAISTTQVAAYIDRAARRIDDLSTDALRSRDARDFAEARYRQLSDQASDMLTEIDLTGRILYANPAHQTLLGFDPEHLVGRYIDEVFPPGPGVGGAPNSTQVAQTVSHRRLVRARDHENRIRFLECDVARFQLDEGDERIIVTSRDVTQRILQEREHKAGQQQLESLVEERTLALDTSLERLRHSERLASMGTLAAGIAHQINNPIGSIRMTAEYALAVAGESAEKDTEQTHESLQQIVEHAKRCGAIVSSMLQFARNEPTPKHSVDLAEIIQRVCDQMKSLARSQSAVIDTKLLIGPLRVFGSAIELEQVMLNLVQNACESSDGPVRVEVKGNRVQGAIWIAVTDDGRGMSHEQVEHALEPFYTTRLGRGGTGLGLSVAHGVVTDHGGYLWIESAPEQGTTVSVSIPAYDTIDPGS